MWTDVGLPCPDCSSLPWTLPACTPCARCDGVRRVCILCHGSYLKKCLLYPQVAGLEERALQALCVRE